MSIALACDLRVASENAFMTTAFRNIGLSGDYGASWFLSRIVGVAKAKELFFTAERISASECLSIGLINRVFPCSTFREDAMSYAQKLADGPSMALSFMKQNINRGVTQGLRESLAMEAEHLIHCASSDDAREAIKAFMEKRKPDFHSN